MKSLPAIIAVVIFAAAASFIFAILAPWSLVVALTAALSFSALAIWIVLRRNPSLEVEEANLGRKWILFLNLAFLCILLVMILSLLLRPNLYVRPTEFFVLVSLAAGVVSVEIATSRYSGSTPWIVLPKVVAIGLSLSFSETLLYPTVVGVDPWWHQMFTLKILEMGHIPGGYPYSNLPIFHLEISSTSLLTGFDYRIATMLSVSALQVIIDALIIFALARSLFNWRIGMLASLLITVANNHIRMSYWAIPNTLGVTMVLFILYLVLKRWQTGDVIARNLAFVLMFVLLLTHTVAALALSISLFVGWTSVIVFGRVFTGAGKTRLSLQTAVAFSVAMFGWWTYASNQLREFVIPLKWGLKLDLFSRSPQQVVEYSAGVPLWEQVFNSLGVYLFFAFALIGCFYMFSRKCSNSKAFAIAAIGIVILLVPYLSFATGHFIIEDRWWYSAQVIMSIPFAVSLILIRNFMTRRSLRTAVQMTIVVVVAFLMTISWTANVDNYVLSPDMGGRTALTDSELETGKALVTFGGVVGSDGYYADSLRYLGAVSERIDGELLNGSFDTKPGVVILLRSEIIHHTFFLYSDFWKLGYDPNIILDTQGFSRIYDCSSVRGYIWTA